MQYLFECLCNLLFPEKMAITELNSAMLTVQILISQCLCFQMLLPTQGR